MHLLLRRGHERVYLPAEHRAPHRFRRVDDKFRVSVLRVLRDTAVLKCGPVGLPRLIQNNRQSHVHRGLAAQFLHLRVGINQTSNLVDLFFRE